MYIQVQTYSQVTEVYSSQLSLKTHVLPTCTTMYNIGPNGTNGGPLKRTFTETLILWSQRRQSGVS